MIIYLLNYKENLCLAILPKVNKNLELCFYYSILTINLVIGLELKSGRNLVFDIKKNLK